MSLDGATLEGAMMHLAFTLSVRGIPQFYYGEEIAMEGRTTLITAAIFPAAFPAILATLSTPPERKPREQKMFEWTRAWLRLRAEHPALRRGQLDRSLL